MIGDIRTKVLIEERDFAHEYAILICRTDNGSIYEVADTDGWYKPRPQGLTIQPTLKLSNDQMDALARACIDWANRKGIRTDSEEKTQGKLEATKYHLEDLRKMLKLRE